MKTRYYVEMLTVPSDHWLRWDAHHHCWRAPNDHNNAMGFDIYDDAVAQYANAIKCSPQRCIRVRKIEEVVKETLILKHTAEMEECK